MGACSSGQARLPREKDLTDVLMKYSQLVQPDVFASLIDFLKQHEIISDSWTKRISSAPKDRSISKAEQQSKSNKDSGEPLLEQQRQIDQQEIKITSLTAEIKRLKTENTALRIKDKTFEQRSTESAGPGGEQESTRYNKITIERKGDEVHSLADKRTQVKQEQRLTSHNVSLTEKGDQVHSLADKQTQVKLKQRLTSHNVSLTEKEIRNLSKEILNDRKQLVSELESIKEQSSEGRAEEREACQKSATHPEQKAVDLIAAFEKERKCFLSKTKQYEETIETLQNKISVMEDEVNCLRLSRDQLTRELETEQQKGTDLVEQIVTLRGDNTAMSSTIKRFQETVSEMERKQVVDIDELNTLSLTKKHLTKESINEQHKTHVTPADQRTLKGGAFTVGKLQRNCPVENIPVARKDDSKTIRLKKDQLREELVTVGQGHNTTCPNLEKQTASLRGDNTVQSSIVKTSKQNVAVFETHLGGSQDELQTLQLKMDKLTRKLETEQQKHRTTSTDLGKQIESLRGNNNVLSSKFVKLQQNIAEFEKQLSISEDELKKVRLSKDLLAGELTSEKQGHHTTRTDLGEQIASLRGDNSGLSSTVVTLQRNVSVLERQLGVKEEELRTLRLDKEQLTQDLKTEKQGHRTTRTDLGKQIASLRGDNSVLSSTVDRLKLNVIELEKQLAARKDELKTSTLNEEILTQKLELKQQTCADLEEHILLLKGDNTAMSSTVEKLKRDIAMMKRELDAEYQQSHRLHLEAGEAVGMLDLSWRAEPIFDHQYLQNLREEVEQYWPLRSMGVSAEALRHVNILFIGPIGAGKSSFLNSVESTFRGYVALTAEAGSRTKSVTSMYRQYPVLASDNRHAMKFRLCDCRGLEDRIGISKDINSILEGHMSHEYVFNTSFPLTRNMYGYKHNPSLEDRIHCVVYVLDAKTYSEKLGIPFVTESVRNQIKTVQEAVDRRGIPQMALLSKVDNICEATNRDTSMVNRSEVIRQRCVDAAGCLGLPPLTVMPMRNYFWETSTTDDISILALFNIRQMLRAADDFLRANHLDELRADKTK